MRLAATATIGWGKYNRSQHTNFKSKHPKVNVQTSSLFQFRVAPDLIPGQPAPSAHLCLPALPWLPPPSHTGGGVLTVLMDTFQLHPAKTISCCLVVHYYASHIFMKGTACNTLSQHLGEKKIAQKGLIILPDPEHTPRQWERGKPRARAELSGLREVLLQYLTPSALSWQANPCSLTAWQLRATIPHRLWGTRGSARL